jgi:hypothetical protein
MKNLKYFILLVALISLCIGQSFSQNENDFRTHQNGNWNDVNTWERYDATTLFDWEYPASHTPDSLDAAITILNGHTVTVTASVGVDEVTVNAGGQVTVNGGTIILMIGAGGMTVNGTLLMQGNVPTVAPFTVSRTTGTLTIGNGGLVQYDQTGTTSGDKGALPTATWQTGSTLLVTRTGGNGATGFNAGGGQNFYNLTWNCPNQTGNFGMAFTNHTIGGNVNILSTGATARLYLMGGSSGTLHINGNFFSQAVNFATTGSGNQTFDTVYFHGKIKVIAPTSASNFALTRGSQSGGTGTVIWYLSGDSINITGTATLTMGNSNYGAGMTKIYLAKSGTQYVTLNTVTLAGYNGTTSGAGFPFEVLSGSNTYLSLANITYSANPSIISRVWSGGTLNLGSSVIGGTGTHVVDGSVTFTTGRIEGTLTRNITSGTTGIVNLMSANTYINIQASPTPTITSVTIKSYPNTAPTDPGPSYDATRGVNRYYDITSITGTGNVNPRFDYLVSEQGVNFVASNGVVWAYTVGPWVNMGGTGAASYAETTTPIAGASLAGKYVIAAAAAALPVQFASFTGSYVGNSAKLEWSTISEVNNYGFNVQRLNEASKNFETVGFVEGKGTTLQSQSYSYTDAVAGTAYRLEQLDNDGLKNYFGPIYLNPNSLGDNSVPAVFALNQNYPNPFNPSTKISFSLANANYTTLKVYNIVGKEVATLFNGSAEAGKQYVVNFDASQLTSGIYFYKLQSGSSVEVKKLTLVK